MGQCELFIRSTGKHDCWENAGIWTVFCKLRMWRGQWGFF